MLAGEVSFFSSQAGNRDSTLPFQKPDHGRYRVLGGNRDAYVHMVRHQVSLDNLTLLLPARGRSHPVPDAFGRKSLFAAVWVRTQTNITNTTWYLQSHLEWDRL